jgi:hypothetical protein
MAYVVMACISVADIFMDDLIVACAQGSTCQQMEAVVYRMAVQICNPDGGSKKYTIIVRNFGNRRNNWGAYRVRSIQGESRPGAQSARTVETFSWDASLPVRIMTCTLWRNQEHRDCVCVYAVQLGWIAQSSYNEPNGQCTPSLNEG